MPPPKKPDLSTYKGRLAARIRKLRIESGLTTQEAWERVVKFSKNKEELEDRVPKSLNSYLAWESGKGSPHYDFLPVLVKVLKLKDVHELMPKK